MLAKIQESMSVSQDKSRTKVGSAGPMQPTPTVAQPEACCCVRKVYFPAILRLALSGQSVVATINHSFVIASEAVLDDLL